MAENGPSHAENTPLKRAGPSPASSLADDGAPAAGAGGHESSRESEASYRGLFESAGDAIVLLDETGFIGCNDATLRFFQCPSREALLSRHPSELSPPCQPDGSDSRIAADNRMEQALRDGVARFEWLHRRMDGSEVMADVVLTRVDLKQRKILHAVVRDITERKRLEEKLREAHDELERSVHARTAELAAANEELRREVADRKRAEEDLAYERFLLNTLMENAPDLIYFKDINSRFIRISKCQADYYGLHDPSEAIGKSDIDFYDPDRARQYMEDEQEIMRTGRAVVDKEEEQVWPDGRVKWLLTSKLPLRNADREIIGTFGLSLDITDRKRAERQLQEAKDAAEAANRAKSDFLANMSHEIRTPMNAVIGMTELVLDTDLTDTQRNYLEMVRDSADSLLALINDILDFSKIEAGKLELIEAPFLIRECLGDTLKSMALRAHTKGLELAFRIHPDVPERLVGDVGRLRQIILNLVGNAIKFTDEGEVVLRVQREPSSKTEVVLLFTVSDTGIGIPESKRRAIFAAFEQADNSTARRFGGTGLGLAICVRLVEALRGGLWLESEVGQGSIFHFSLPFAVAEPLPEETEPATPGTLRHLRVLVVDDNATNRLILEEMLRNWGMRPSVASSAGEALAQMREAVLRAEPFALLLTDAHMPDIDGFNLVEQIKQDDNLSSTVIMMLTSGGRSGDVARCERLGIATFLLKPIKQSELFDAIVQAMESDSADDSAERLRAGEFTDRLGALRVLLAEDSHVNQRLAVGLLEKYGHHVVVANNGREAVAYQQSRPFDLILMDVQMPEVDGFEATRIIRASEKKTKRHVPIIAMTAHAMKGDRERCLDAGMDDYVAKPIRARQLFETIEDVLGRSRIASDAPRGEQPPQETTGLVDWIEALKSVAGDNDLLIEVIEAFIEEAHRLMNEMQRAVSSMDATSLRIASHTLKGGLKYFGAWQTYELAYALEEFGRNNEMEGAAGVLTRLQDHMRRLVPELRDYVVRHGTDAR